MRSAPVEGEVPRLWLAWWYRNALVPFVLPPQTGRRLLLAAKIVVLTAFLVVFRPSLRPAGIHVAQALGGAAAGVALFHAFRHLFWRHGDGTRPLDWAELAGWGARRAWASAFVGATFLAYAVFEEALWRYVVQDRLLGGTLPAVAIVACLFTAEHLIAYRPCSAVQATELLALAIALGLSMWATGTVVAGVFLHWIRNLYVLRFTGGLDSPLAEETRPAWHERAEAGRRKESSPAGTRP